VFPPPSIVNQVKLPPNVLASRVTDVSERGWFYLPDGRMDPFWLAVKERCGKKLKVSRLPPMHPSRPHET
jgi:hypothetical protein